jgi:hypothetical protein
LIVTCNGSRLNPCTRKKSPNHKLGPPAPALTAVGSRPHSLSRMFKLRRCLYFPLELCDRAKLRRRHESHHLTGKGQAPTPTQPRMRGRGGGGGEGERGPLGTIRRAAAAGPRRIWPGTASARSPPIRVKPRRRGAPLRALRRAAKLWTMSHAERRAACRTG